MVNRRAFLQSSVALSAVSLPGASALAAHLHGRAAATVRIERFVFDERFAAALETARHAACLGIALTPISGDLTRLWYDDLDLRWKNAPMALAGITTSAGLFVLETLAADRRMRVAYRGEHAVAIDGRATHFLAGPAGLVARARPPADASPWGAVLGAAMTQCPSGDRAPVRIQFTTRAEQDSVRAEPLYSWIIAPRVAVPAVV